MGRLRRAAIGCVTMLALAGQPGFGWAQAEQGPANGSGATSVPRAQAQTDMRPIVVGLGAIAGVVVFNVAALGIEALPGGFAYAGGAMVPAEMSVAMSRVYATTAAVVGAWVAYYGYER